MGIIVSFWLAHDEITKLALEEEIKTYFNLNLDCGVATETV